MEDYKKKYEQIVAKAKAIHNLASETSHDDIRKVLEELFDELKESEDERIRKALLNEFIDLQSKDYKFAGLEAEEIVAWLEKQGEHKSTLPNEDEKIRKELIKLMKQMSNTIVENYTTIEISTFVAWLEKQGEKIDVIENFDTEFEKQVSHLLASTINKEHEYNEGFVKWTANALLNYAKHELGKQGESCYPYQPGWRKNYSDNKPKVKHSVLMLTTHGIAEGEWLGEEWCQYRWSCKIKDEDVLYWLHLSDLENLEKENGEQKLVDKCKDCNNIKGCITCIDGDQYAHITEQKPTDKVKPKKELKKIEQKPAWSEEDEHRVGDTIYFLETAKKHYASDVELNACIDWLKSLKDRI